MFDKLFGWLERENWLSPKEPIELTPEQVLDCEYEKLLEIQLKVLKSLEGLRGTRNELSENSNKLKLKALEQEAKAKEALGNNKEELAKQYISNKLSLQNNADRLDAKIKETNAKEEKLTVDNDSISTKITLLKSTKNELKAQYNSSKLQKDLNESLTGVSEDGFDISGAIKNIQEEIEKFNLRSEAVEELVEEHVLDNVMEDTFKVKDSDIEKELKKLKGGEKDVV